MGYAPIYPHGEVGEIGNDIFMVRGSIKLNPLVRISRNMVLVREGDEISLINPIRVNDDVLGQIKRIGTVKHLIRTGAFHGIDDPFYIDQFKPTMWSQPGGLVYTQPPPDVEINATSQLPFSNAAVVIFGSAKQPECALHLSDDDGLLVTCDAIQHYGDYSYNNFLAKLMMPFIGFPKTTIVGPIWLKLMTPDGGSLEDDVRQLLSLQFNRLIAAHGTYLEHGAHAAVEKAIDKAFSKK
ncbi:MAG: hypothetical protein ACU84Q_05310 [Gammaproteobacteria bacterium]